MSKDVYVARKIAILLLFFILSACSIGPTYAPPVASVPLSWSDRSKPVASNLNAWWRHFHDPILNALIEQQAPMNLNVKIAQTRVRMAEAEYAAASSQLFPKINADLLPPNGTGFDITQVLALTASIDPDFFGKLRATRQLAEVNIQAGLADKDFTILNLQAEIASSYLEFRAAQAKKNNLKDNIEGNKQVLAILKSRYQTGLSNYMDIARQEALIETQRAGLEQNSALIMVLLHKLEILTGNNPGMLAKQLLPFRAVPQMSKTIHLGIPSELLRRRPDIIAAEKRVEAAHANIRSAIADLFPQMNLGWLFAWQTQTLASNLFAMKNPDSSFFGLLNAPIFNLSLYKAINVRKREKALAVIQYELVVMGALHEVETQYLYCNHYRKSTRHYRNAVEKKRLVLKLAKDMYQKGITDFNTVFLTEQELNQLEMAYIHEKVIYETAQINLFKALGGDIYAQRDVVQSRPKLMFKAG